MPPYENQSMHDMHALIQQFDTLNAAHTPDHLDKWLPTYQDVKDAANAGAKKVSDTYDSTKTAVNKKIEDRKESSEKKATEKDQRTRQLATDQEMIDYRFSQDVPRQAEYLKLVIGSVNFPLADLLKMMSQSSVMKTAILNTWYPEGISEEKRKQVYEANHPKPAPKPQ
jgi:hypothetical protein